MSFRLCPQAQKSKSERDKAADKKVNAELDALMAGGFGGDGADMVFL